MVVKHHAGWQTLQFYCHSVFVVRKGPLGDVRGTSSCVHFFATQVRGVFETLLSLCPMSGEGVAARKALLATV